MKNWSVGVRAMLSRLKHDHFDSLKDIDDAIREAGIELKEARKHMREIYLKESACTHKYKPATYSIQRMLLGFVRVNKRVCESCGHLEFETEGGGTSSRSEWAKDAKETYCNNNI